MRHAEQRLSPCSTHARRFWEMARSGSYDDVLYKVETNAKGDVVSEPPPSRRHKALQRRIVQLLDRALSGGEAVTEFPIHTSEGTKLPDVAWLSAEAWNASVADDMAVVVPLVCAEVLCPSNTDVEMEEKRRIYLDLGVDEVWICDEKGRIRVFTEQGEADASQFVGDLPDPIDIRSSERGGAG